MVKCAARWIVLALQGASVAACPVPAQAQSPTVRPLTRAHAHNDYEHRRPLLDALDRGFCSVEADIHLVGGQLLVAHDRDKVAPDRTLGRLYLDPLWARVKENGGRVYRGGPTILLLVDFKSEAASTYAALRDVLRCYPAMLTEFRDDGVRPGAVTVIVSGNLPRAEMAAESSRWAALDGRPADLKASPSAALMPLVSENWNRLFQWRGTGPFPASEASRLRALVVEAHGGGRRIRFWGTPDVPAMWTQLFDAGVDLLGTDDLAALSSFLEGR